MITDAQIEAAAQIAFGSPRECSGSEWGRRCNVMRAALEAAAQAAPATAMEKAIYEKAAQIARSLVVHDCEAKRAAGIKFACACLADIFEGLAAAQAAPAPTAAPGEYNALCERLELPIQEWGPQPKYDDLSEAAAAIRKLTDNLAWAEHTIEEQRIRINDAEARAAALEKAIRDYLNGDYEHPRVNRPNPCKHNTPYWEACEQCNDAHFEAALAKETK